MKTAIILFSVLVGALGLTELEVGQQWATFKVNYRKSYRSTVDDMKRLDIFKQNLQKIEAHNKLYDSGKVSHRKGVNQFADMTETEFMEYLNKHGASRPERSDSALKFKPSSLAELPRDIDWRKKGAVTPVVDQGSCGASWAFSTVGALEALNGLKNGDLTPLSQQNLIDCVNDNGGCRGGSTFAAYEYVQRNGIERASEYPSTAADESCQFSVNKSALIISGYIDLLPGDEESLRVAVGTMQPISVEINVSSELQLYQDGVLEDRQCTNSPTTLNHAVLLVGYGYEWRGPGYWLIKNSWGTSWGEEGYFRLDSYFRNSCGIANAASFPVA